MVDYTIVYKGKEYHVKEMYDGWGTELGCPELNLRSSFYYTCMDVVLAILEKIGCESYIVNAVKEEKDSSYLYSIADRYRSSNMSIKDAEKEFNRRMAHIGWFQNKPVTDFFDLDEYDDYEEDLVGYEIKRHIGWRISQDVFNKNNYIERQHMSVVCQLGCGQIEPQWYMEFRNPDMLGVKLNIDKIIDDIRLEMANKELEYFDDYEEEDA